MGPLNGLKVVDLTTMVSGPVASMMLADQGAQVVKVEPLAGEQMRHIGPPHNGVTSSFFSCNRGKQSIALDLTSEEGKKILLELVYRHHHHCLLVDSWKNLVSVWIQ